MIKSLYRFLSPKFQNVFLDYKVAFKPRYGHGKPPHSLLYNIINSNRKIYADILTDAVRYKEVFHAIQKADAESDVNQPAYNNGFLPGLDIIGIYTMIARAKPATYVEVGSGNSTKVAYKSIKDNNLQTKIISIDPYPRAEIDHLADTVIRQPFESTNFEFIFSLKENDILFIDNSHRILPNSDAMVFFMEVLPKVPKGVIVHIHDIYLPYDYPQFMCDRAYSEQYGLAMFLMANSDKYSTLLPNYFISEDKELSSILNPVWEHENLQNVEKHGGSYWIMINK
ncbi:MAG: class I SAM-dependent methyltransferase [Cytophagaceae bacterium]